MIIENKIDFVMSRDGYILVCQEETRGKYGNYVKLPPSATASSKLYFLPGFVTATRIAGMDNSYYEITNGIWFYNAFTRLMERKDTSKSVKKRLQKVTDTLASVLQGAINRYTNEYFSEEDTVRVDYLAVESTGSVVEGIMEYTKPAGLSLTRKEEVSFLKTGKGSDWFFSANYNTNFKLCLKAAMLSTDSKEHLLQVLRRIGAISEGEWLTVPEYIEKYDIAGTVLQQAHKNMTSMAKFAAGDDYETLKEML